MGKDATDATAHRHRKEAELNAQNNGVSCLKTEKGHPSVAQPQSRSSGSKRRIQRCDRLSILALVKKGNRPSLVRGRSGRGRAVVDLVSF